jgi:hypothetical protein
VNRYTWLGRDQSFEINPEPQCNLFVCLNDTAQTLAKAVFIEFFAGIGVPKAASIRGELIT